MDCKHERLRDNGLCVHYIEEAFAPGFCGRDGKFTHCIKEVPMTGEFSQSELNKLNQGG